MASPLLGPLAFLTAVSLCGAQTNATRILCIGDSITESFANSSVIRGSYRSTLWRLLRNNGFCVDFIGVREGVQANPILPSATDPTLPVFDPDHMAQSGTPAFLFVTALPGLLAMTEVPDVALIHLGTADVALGAPLPQIRADLTTIVGQLRNRNRDIRIVLAQVMPTLSTAHIPAVTALSQDIGVLAGNLNTNQSPVKPADMFTSYPPGTTGFIPGDPVHPNELGEQFLANQFFNALLPLIQLLPAGKPCVMQYGLGCLTSTAGCGAFSCRPVLALSSGQPRIGASFTLTASRFPLSASIAVAAFGLSDTLAGTTPLPAPFGATCFIFSSPDATATIGCTNGIASFTFSVPNNPVFVGTLLFSQFSAPDGGSLAFTGSIRALIGVP